jgi:hypothetical protein
LLNSVTMPQTLCPGRVQGLTLQHLLSANSTDAEILKAQYRILRTTGKAALAMWNLAYQHLTGTGL